MSSFNTDCVTQRAGKQLHNKTITNYSSTQIIALRCNVDGLVTLSRPLRQRRLQIAFHHTWTKPSISARLARPQLWHSKACTPPLWFLFEKWTQYTGMVFSRQCLPAYLHWNLSVGSGPGDIHQQSMGCISCCGGFPWKPGGANGTTGPAACDVAGGENCWPWFWIWMTWICSWTCVNCCCMACICSCMACICCTTTCTSWMTCICCATCGCTSLMRPTISPTAASKLNWPLPLLLPFSSPLPLLSEIKTEGCDLCCSK